MVSWSPLGGLGRRPRVNADPDGLTVQIPHRAPGRDLKVTASEDDAVTVPYADPPGGTRAVSHAALLPSS